jgi:RHS repeat-associated protein
VSWTAICGRADGGVTAVRSLPALLVGRGAWWIGGACLDMRKGTLMLPRLGHLLLLVSLLASLLPPAAPAAASALSTPAAHVSSAPLSSPQSLTQTSTTDFGACATANGTTTVTTGGGTVQLAGALADDFTTPQLDAARWQWGVWSTGSYTPSLDNGALEVDAPGGAWVRSRQTFLAATVEARLTFGAAPWQHFGFGADGLAGGQFALFSTAASSDHLYARLDNNSGSEQALDLGAIPQGAHRYRIAWTKAITTDQLQFFLDDALVADLTENPLPPLYVYLSNNTPGTPLLLDDVQTMPPFVGSGTFVSCPFDATASTTWQTLSWTADTPADTLLGAETRTSLDGSAWSAWAGVAGGALANPHGRYLQYRLTLATDDTQLSPLVTAVTATYDDTASAPADGETLTHTTAGDFAACGGLSDTAISDADDGALRLRGGLLDYFDQATLDSGRWAWGSWSSGSYLPQPSDGTVSVDADGGAWIRSQQTFSQTTVAANLTFGAAPWQHFGFGSDAFEGNRYALFSTLSTTTTLYARLNNNGSEQAVDLGAIPEGSHRYRIAWRSAGANDQVTFYRDGLLVASLLVAPLPPLYVYLSNNTPGTPLVVDDVQTLAPFVSSGSLLSCPFDAGTAVDWQTLSWAADVPLSTTLSVQARSSADGSSWSSWSSVTAGAALSVPSGRYLQYQLTLTSSDPQRSPTVFAVAARHEPVVITNPPPTTPPLADPHLPSLSLRLSIAPDPVVISDTATITLTVANEAADAAAGLVVSLPTPDGVLPLSGPTISSPFVGWQWNVGALAAQSSLALTATLRLQSMPSGKALLFHAQATADGLTQPIAEDGGALVLDPSFGPASAVFTPGATTVLTSSDGALTLQVPPTAATTPLTLTVSPATPASPSFQRGFGTFALDATDAAGAAVHQFSVPITLTLRYTPEQLQARGLAERDLTLFWFDPTTPITQTDGSVTLGAWQALALALDAATHTATALVSHFSNFQFADGASPSAAFLPSLQGFQVSQFTGAASYSYPIELPAGPGGLKPSLSLSYSSGATDGTTGQRLKNQAAWVGLGWSLDTGAVARNKLPNGDATYSLVLNGQSYTLSRGAALSGSPYSTNHLMGWDWSTTDDAFLRVRAMSDNSWAAWTTDGTRYDFSTAAVWAWGSSGQPSFETYKWLLTSITDTHGNTINYTYDRLQETQSFGTVDKDIWPSTISWAGGRYQVNFISTARPLDTQFEGAPNQYPNANAAPHQTRELDSIDVWSKPAGSWQRVRQYLLRYAAASSSLTPDQPLCPSSCSANSAYPKLTLMSITRVGAYDGAPSTLPALPATTFGYGGFSVVQNGHTWPGGGWNRLTSINNGQGGTLTLAYANVGQVVNNTLMDNTRRLTSRTLSDGRGHSYTWSYSYGTPNVNTLGATRGPQSPWGYGSWGTQAFPNSAALYYNAFTDVAHNSQDWLAAQPMREFRGHDWMLETDPNGAQTRHFFYQGAASDHCIPTVSGAAIPSDACFQRLRDGELLKGKEYQTQVFAAGANVATADPLQETDHSFSVLFESYTATPLSGLWKAFTLERQTDAQQAEGTATPVVATTKRFYNTNCTADTLATMQASNGNVGCIQEYNGATLVRTAKRFYLANDVDSWTWRDANNNLLNPPTATVRYLVDRMWGEDHFDGAGHWLSVLHQFYDALPTGSTGPSVGTVGDLRLVRRYYDVPSSCCTGVTLHGQDTRYDYDAYGNQTAVVSYAGPGTFLNGVYSTPGNGSAGRTTSTTYDSVFHTFATQETNPLSQSTRADYDYRMGTLLRVTGPNVPLGTTPANCAAASYVIQATEESTCAQYDVFGRLVKLVKPGDSTTYPTLQAYYYDSEQPFRYRVDRREDAGTANARIAQQFYDGLGRLIQTKAESAFNAQNIVTETRYDGLDHAIEQSQARYVSENATTFYQYTSPGSGALFNHTSTSYDSLGRPIRITTPDGHWMEHQYGLAAGLTYHDIVDANRHRTQTRSDALGRLVNVYEIGGDCGTGSYSWASCVAPTTATWGVSATTTYAYSALDQLTTVTDTAGNVTSMSYDSLGRKTGMDDPDMGVWNYSYDANGNLVTQTDAKGQTLWFGYDALNRQTQKRQTSSSGTLLAQYTYDQSSTTNQGIGQRTQSSAGGIVEQWEYDARGRKTKTTDTVAGLSGTRIFGSTYDSADRLRTLSLPAFPNGIVQTLTYSYDAAWRPNRLFTSNWNVYLLNNASYTALDQPVQWTFNNSIVQTWSYSSPMARLSRLQVGSGTPASVFDRSYSYDNVGNVTTIVDNTTAPIPSQSYSYDHRDRLTSWTLGSITQTYTYNMLGNITSKPGNGVYTYPASGPTSTRPHTPSAVNGASYVYDANGNLTAGGGRTYTWTIDNLPASISQTSGSESYSYDADGERIKKVAGTVTTVYLEGGLWEEVVGGVVKASYSFNNQTAVLYTTSPSAFTYLTNDHLGSASVATSQAQAKTQQEYDPWGKVRSGGISATSINFTGQRLDGTGLLYYHARMYDPVLGRFVSADSIIPGQSYRTGASNPQNLNRYSYVGNNPVNRTDPTGHVDERGSGGAEGGGYGGGCVGSCGGGGGGEGGRGGGGGGRGAAGATISSTPPQIDPVVEEQTVVARAGEAEAAPGEAPTGPQTMNPNDIRFSQDSASYKFKDGRNIDDLAEGLRNGSIDPKDVPPIRLVEREGKLYTLDNRRLAAFQKAGVDVPYRMATPQEVARDAFKFTTKNEGISIRIRGGPQ